MNLACDCAGQASYMPAAQLWQPAAPRQVPRPPTHAPPQRKPACPPGLPPNPPSAPSTPPGLKHVLPQQPATKPHLGQLLDLMNAEAPRPCVTAQLSTHASASAQPTSGLCASAQLPAAAQPAAPDAAAQAGNVELKPPLPNQPMQCSAAAPGNEATQQRVCPRASMYRAAAVGAAGTGAEVRAVTKPQRSLEDLLRAMQSDDDAPEQRPSGHVAAGAMAQLAAQQHSTCATRSTTAVLCTGPQQVKQEPLTAPSSVAERPVTAAVQECVPRNTAPQSAAVVAAPAASQQTCHGKDANISGRQCAERQAATRKHAQLLAGGCAPAVPQPSAAAHAPFDSHAAAPVSKCCGSSTRPGEYADTAAKCAAPAARALKRLRPDMPASPMGACAQASSQRHSRDAGCVRVRAAGTADSRCGTVHERERGARARDSAPRGPEARTSIKREPGARRPDAYDARARAPSHSGGRAGSRAGCTSRDGSNGAGLGSTSTVPHCLSGGNQRRSQSASAQARCTHDRERDHGRAAQPGRNSVCRPGMSAAPRTHDSQGREHREVHARVSGTHRRQHGNCAEAERKQGWTKYFAGSTGRAPPAAKALPDVDELFGC